MISLHMFIIRKFKVSTYNNTTSVGICSRDGFHSWKSSILGYRHCIIQGIIND